MPKGIKVWQVKDGKLMYLDTSFAEAGRTEKEDLEKWIRTNPSILGDNLVIVGEQVYTSDKSGIVDFIAMDDTGNVIVVELKRDLLTRDVVAQGIDYISDFAQWSFAQFDQMCRQQNGKDLKAMLKEAFAETNVEDVSVNEAQRLFIVGFQIDFSLQRMVEWLSENGVPVNVIILKYVRTAGGEEFVLRTTLVSEEEEERHVRRRRSQTYRRVDPEVYSDIEKIVRNELPKEQNDFNLSYGRTWNRIFWADSYPSAPYFFGVYEEDGVGIYCKIKGDNPKAIQWFNNEVEAIIQHFGRKAAVAGRTHRELYRKIVNAKKLEELGEDEKSQLGSALVEMITFLKPKLDEQL